LLLSFASCGSRRGLQIIIYRRQHMQRTCCHAEVCNKEYERVIKVSNNEVGTAKSHHSVRYASKNEIFQFQNISFILALKPLRPALVSLLLHFTLWLSLILRKADSSRSALYPDSPNLRFPSYTCTNKTQKTKRK